MLFIIALRGLLNMMICTRLLIQKHATGYYVFGGHMFNSLDAVVEHYKKEIILDCNRTFQSEVCIII